MPTITDETRGVQPSDAPRDTAGRWRRALPWLVLAAGAAFLAWLLTFTRPGVFYSGDGGLKLLLVKQFARGELHPDLRIHAQPWVKELWAGGLFPFERPFTWTVRDRIFAWCGLPFQVLTAPFYAVLGWRGLYVWPVVGVLATWAALWRLCGRLGLGPAWTALTLFTVVFCSPLTIYGAIYWEHTIAVALATTGLALLAAPASRFATREGFLAGFVLGLSAWFRFELAWLAAVTVAILPFAPRLGVELRGRRAFLAGVALAGAGLIAWNAAVYGAPLGMAGIALAEEGGLASRAVGFARLYPALLKLLTLHGPAVALAAAMAAALHMKPSGGEASRGQARLWTLLGSVFVLGVPLVLPSGFGGDGGNQFGPRYLLVVFPMASLVLALSSRALWARASSLGRAVIAAALAAGLGAGIWVNAVAGAIDLWVNYSSRIAPLLEAVRADPARSVAVADNFMAMELVPLLGSKHLFRVKGMAELRSLAFVLSHRGERHFLFVNDLPLTEELLLIESGDRISLRMRPIACFEGPEWCLHDARVTPSAAP